MLKGLKNGKSFSETVVDLVKEKKKKKDIMQFAGLWANDPYWDKFLKDTRKSRNRAKI